MEVVLLITSLYDKDIHNGDYAMNIYSTMQYIMTTETNQQVKITVMDFWLKVINTMLKKQGMMDGGFPEVTFSKELKRIITFDKPKIKQCLTAALTELSNIGCLATFVFVLKHEADPKICEAAEKNLLDFIDLLNKHKVNSGELHEIYLNCRDYCTSPNVFNEISPVMSPSGPVDLNSIDVEELWDPECFEANTGFDDVSGRLRNVTPHDFLKFVHSEMDQYRNRHKRKLKPKNDLDQVLEVLRVL